MRPEPLVRSVALLLMGIACSGALAKEPQELIWDNMIPYKQDKVESALKDPSKDLDMLINEDPYEDGWLVRIAMSDESELGKLMDAAEYATFIEEEKNKEED